MSRRTGACDRRPYGTGSLFERRGSWFGQWRVGGRLVKRKLGSSRSSGKPNGLTRKQAESVLRRLMQEAGSARPEEQIDTAELGERYLRHLTVVLNRKPTTISDYRSILRAHLVPYLGTRPIERIKEDDFSRYMALKLDEGLSPKTVRNHLAFASGLFSFATKRRLITTNPLSNVDRPRADGASAEIRYLDPSEVEALIDAIPDDHLGDTDRTLYLVAAMTGLRQGELHALRWRDVDWQAGLIRVRRSVTRGRMGTPKTRRSSRAVPITDRVIASLRAHFEQSHYRADDDLVLCHPETGHVYDASSARKRFKRALAGAGVRTVRFHDLRHTFGTGMARVGMPMRTLQELMGHSEIQTTLVYADYAPRPEDERAWAERAFPCPEETSLETGCQNERLRPTRGVSIESRTEDRLE